MTPAVQRKPEQLGIKPLVTRHAFLVGPLTESADGHRYLSVLGYIETLGIASPSRAGLNGVEVPAEMQDRLEFAHSKIDVSGT